VNKPDKTIFLNAKWIFKNEKDQNRETRYKNRLVVQGCTQTKGIDYEKTFASVATVCLIKAYD